MPHPDAEHGLQIQLATALREAERLEGTLASAFGDLRESEKRADKAEEALAAARRECEGLRAVAQAVIMFHSARVWDDAASEEWHRLTGGPSTTKGLCDFARAALGIPAAGENTR